MGMGKKEKKRKKFSPQKKGKEKPVQIP